MGERIVAAGEAITFVESRRPPSPVSNKHQSASVSEKAKKAAAVVISKKVIGSLPFTSFVL